MSFQSPQGVPLSLTDTERAVVRCAIDYYLDEGIEYADYDGSEAETTLEQHHETATEESCIHVVMGIDELYQSVFRQYARALQETVDEEEGTDSMGQFFESVFKSVVSKIQGATSQMGF